MARKVDPAHTSQMRARIASEAGRLFAAHGYERTSVSEIAGALGTSSGSIFYYFKDKAALFRAVFEKDIPAAENLIAKYLDSSDPLEAVLDLVEALGEDASDPSASGMLVELLRHVGEDPELLEIVDHTASVLRSGIASLISRGIADGSIDASLDAEETASWLQAIVDAAYLNARPGYSPRLELRRTVLGYLSPKSNH